MCNIDFDDMEPFEFVSTKNPTAKKTHRCDCCQGPIAVGDQYRVMSGKCDGSFFAEKMCPACCAMADQFLKDHGAYSNPSAMPELLSECVEYDDNPETRQVWQVHLDRIRAVSATP